MRDRPGAGTCQKDAITEGFHTKLEMISRRAYGFRWIFSRSAQLFQELLKPWGYRDLSLGCKGIST
jgi:hypothetical protein